MVFAFISEVGVILKGFETLRSRRQRRIRGADLLLGKKKEVFFFQRGATQFLKKRRFFFHLAYLLHPLEEDILLPRGEGCFLPGEKDVVPLE